MVTETGVPTVGWRLTVNSLYDWSRSLSTLATLHTVVTPTAPPSLPSYLRLFPFTLTTSLASCIPSFFHHSCRYCCPRVIVRHPLTGSCLTHSHSQPAGRKETRKVDRIPGVTDHMSLTFLVLFPSGTSWEGKVHSKNPPLWCFTVGTLISFQFTLFS